MRKLLLISTLLVSACTMGPDYERFAFELPDVWGKEAPAATAAAEDKKLPTEWWTQFHDPALTALVEEGLAANGDLALAAGRVAEARAILNLRDAQQYPTLSAQANADRTSRSSEARFGGFATPSKPFNTFGISAVLDYEISLWGRLQRATEAARATLLSEQANRDAIRLAVASDIATGYFNLLALDAQAAVTRDTIGTRTRTVDYQTKQYKAGQVDVLTQQRAEAELAAAEATLPLIEQARVEQQNALSILLGRSPKAILESPIARTATITDLPIPPVMPVDAPSTLLERRPDVSAAEQQLIAANANIGVAKADYYPTLSLSALLGLSSSNIDRLLRNSARTWSLGAASAAPILDFGKVSANVETSEAQKAQALANYQQVVRLAFGDAANAMNRVKTSDERVLAQTRQVKAYQESARVAGLRYDAGYATQLDQLDAQRQLFLAQLDLINAMQERLSASVTLYKALGGGWDASAASNPK